MNIQISAKWELFFWNCYTLSKMKYNIDNLWKLLYWWDKKVLCWENVCYCDVGILLEKKKTWKSKSIIAIENHLLKSLKKYINNISIDSIIISLDDNIQVIFKEKGIFIYFIVEKPNKSNYSLIKNGLWYWFYAKNESNINMDVKAFYSDNRNKINNLIVILSKFDSVYKKIIK